MKQKLMLLDNVIDDYLSFITVIKHFSSASVEAYSCDLSTFASWLDEADADWQSLSDSDLRVFVSEMLDGGFAVKSINRDFSAIR